MSALLARARGARPTANQPLPASAGARRRSPILVVGDVAAPGHRTARRVGRLDRDVSHEAVRGMRRASGSRRARRRHGRRGGSPRSARRRAGRADALGDEDGLPVRVGVPLRPSRSACSAPRRPRSRCRPARRPRRCAGGPVGRPYSGIDAAAGDLHALLLSGVQSGGLARFRRASVADGERSVAEGEPEDRGAIP